jgi:pyruvate dehydrogenase E1 component beta subunit
MYGWKGEVPDEEYTLPLGQADIKRPGGALTLIGFGKPMRNLLEAAQLLEKDGIDAEVVDLQSLRPLDEKTLYTSVNKTNRCVVVDEDWPVASVGSHVAWLISKNCFDYLDAPVELVAMEDVPMPYNHSLELAVQPSTEKIVQAARNVLYA